MSSKNIGNESISDLIQKKAVLDDQRKRLKVIIKDQEASRKKAETSINRMLQEIDRIKDSVAKKKAAIQSNTLLPQVSASDLFAQIRKGKPLERAVEEPDEKPEKTEADNRSDLLAAIRKKGEERQKKAPTPVSASKAPDFKAAKEVSKNPLAQALAGRRKFIADDDEDEDEEHVVRQGRGMAAQKENQKSEEEQKLDASREKTKKKYQTDNQELIRQITAHITSITANGQTLGQLQARVKSQEAILAALKAEEAEATKAYQLFREDKEKEAAKIAEPVVQASGVPEAPEIGVPAAPPMGDAAGVPEAPTFDAPPLAPPMEGAAADVPAAPPLDAPPLEAAPPAPAMDAPPAPLAVPDAPPFDAPPLEEAPPAPAMDAPPAPVMDAPSALPLKEARKIPPSSSPGKRRAALYEEAMARKAQATGSSGKAAMYEEMAQRTEATRLREAEQDKARDLKNLVTVLSSAKDETYAGLVASIEGSAIFAKKPREFDKVENFMASLKPETVDTLVNLYRAEQEKVRLRHEQAEKEAKRKAEEVAAAEKKQKSDANEMARQKMLQDILPPEVYGKIKDITTKAAALSVQPEVAPVKIEELRAEINQRAAEVAKELPKEAEKAKPVEAPVVAAAAPTVSAPVATAPKAQPAVRVPIPVARAVKDDPEVKRLQDVKIRYMTNVITDKLSVLPLHDDLSEYAMNYARKSPTGVKFPNQQGDLRYDVCMEIAEMLMREPAYIAFEIVVPGYINHYYDRVDKGIRDLQKTEGNEDIISKLEEVRKNILDSFKAAKLSIDATAADLLPAAPPPPRVSVSAPVPPVPSAPAVPAAAVPPVSAPAASAPVSVEAKRKMEHVPAPTVSAAPSSSASDALPKPIRNPRIDKIVDIAKILRGRFNLEQIEEKLDKYRTSRTGLYTHVVYGDSDETQTRLHVANELSSLMGPNALAIAILDNNIDKFSKEVEAHIKTIKSLKSTETTHTKFKLMSVLDESKKILDTLKMEQQHIAKHKPVVTYDDEVKFQMQQLENKHVTDELRKLADRLATYQQDKTQSPGRFMGVRIHVADVVKRELTPENIAKAIVNNKVDDLNKILKAEIKRHESTKSWYSPKGKLTPILKGYEAILTKLENEQKAKLEDKSASKQKPPDPNKKLGR